MKIFIIFLLEEKKMLGGKILDDGQHFIQKKLKKYISKIYKG